MNHNDDINQEEVEFKIIVIGNSKTGKTSYIQKWINQNDKKESCKASVLSDFTSKIVKFNNKKYKVQLWDLGGQDRNFHLTKIFIKNSFGCIILYDATNIQSFKDTKKWKQVVDSNANFIDNDPLPCLIVCNKIDLLKEEDLNNFTSFISNFVAENSFIGGFLTSVKNNININQSIDFLIKHISNRYEQYLLKENILENHIKNKDSNSQNIFLNKPNRFKSYSEKDKCC